MIVYAAFMRAVFAQALTLASSMAKLVRRNGLQAVGKRFYPEKTAEAERIWITNDRSHIKPILFLNHPQSVNYIMKCINGLWTINGETDAFGYFRIPMLW